MGAPMKSEFLINGKTQVILTPENARDKALNRLAFDENIPVAVDLREDGSLVFTLAPKDSR